MARTVTVPVFIGVLRSTGDDPEPQIFVSEAVKGGREFERYKWFRSTVDIQVPDIATTVPSTPATPL